jgi:hypothetical protein
MPAARFAASELVFFRQLYRKVDQIMASLADLQAVAARISTDLAKLAADVAALQSKVGRVDAAYLAPVVAKLSDAAAAMEALDSSVAPPAP